MLYARAHDLVDAYDGRFYSRTYEDQPQYQAVIYDQRGDQLNYVAIRLFASEDMEGRFRNESVGIASTSGYQPLPNEPLLWKYATDVWAETAAWYNRGGDPFDIMIDVNYFVQIMCDNGYHGLGVMPNRTNYATYPDHTGLDYTASEGTLVRSAHNGRVDLIEIDLNKAKKLGTRVRIQIEHGGTTYWVDYAHLSKPLVNVGDRVYAGDVIAISGNTGSNTTGAHLHVEILTGRDNSSGDYDDRLVKGKELLEMLPV